MQMIGRGSRMKFKNRVFICYVLITVFLGSLQGSNQIAYDSLHTHKRSVEEDAFNIIDYLSSFREAHEKYLQKNKIEPEIKCKKMHDQTVRPW